METVKILNARVLNGSLTEMTALADNAIVSRESVFGTGINLDQMYLMRTVPAFARAMDGAVLCPPDGTPVLWIARWMGRPLRQKVTGPSLTLALCELAARKHYKVFVLGGKEGSAERALENLQRRYGMFDAAFYCPPYGFEKDERETAKIVRLLADSRADILLAALSAPKQELFVDRYRRDFGIPVVFGAGIAIDYFAGRIRQAPLWVNRIGMEWLYRLVQEPKRLFSRYILHDLPTLLYMRRWAAAYRRDAGRGPA